MPAKVILTVTKGPLQGRQYVFDERTTCLMGRADDCQARLPSDDQHSTISRHHCLLDINPPDIRVRDFGSRNGTFVNGQKIGQRDDGMTPEQGAGMRFPEYDLKDGHTLELGNTVFRIQVHVPALCTDCSAEIPDEQKTQAERAPGVYRCAACRRPPDATQLAEPPRPKNRVCTHCGRDVSREVSQHRAGDYICAVCQAEPAHVLNQLLALARAGRQDTLAIRGYEVVRELGKGGMGAVYLVRQEQTREQAALKVMLPKVAADERARQMFLREVENTRVLRHPNVVRLHDAGCSQGTFFFTLEYCEGGSVDRLMKERGGPLPTNEACAIILQALSGLEYTHQVEVSQVRQADGSYAPGRGLVHRDLKPQNLFLTGAGGARVVKIGDYGLAKAFDQAGLSGQTCTGTTAGTPAFIPRQQVVNFKYGGPDADVWSLAATLYYLLTGATPRDFGADQDAWQVVLQTSAVPVRARNPRIPARLAEVIDEALIDRPQIRFKTAAEFRRALNSAL